MKDKEQIKDELKQKEIKSKIMKTIKDEFLNGSDKMDSYIGKKLKNITIDYFILNIMFEENMTKFRNKLQTISYPIGKVNYIFSVLEEQIRRP